MFDEKDRELQRLERELLKEEQPQTPPEEDIPFDDGEYIPRDSHVPYRNFANGYHAYTNQSSDVDMDAYSEEVRTGRGKSNTPLIVLALTLFACIILVLCWWVWRYAGVLQ